MENRINIAELLKDCPTGIELDSPVWDNIVFEELDGDSIVIFRKYCNSKVYLTQYGELNSTDGKCVIFPKGKTSWEGFQRPFKDGDILAYNTTVGTSIFIHRNKHNEHTYKTSFYVGINSAGVFLRYNKDTLIALCGDCDTRFATEEERQKLFKVIEANGYKWNDETKNLEKLVESEFNVGDWIIRNNKYTGIPVKVVGFNGYYSCELNGEVVNIPRNDVHNNFHLWTIDDAKDGDVIFYDSGWTCIFKNIHGIWYSSYCFITSDGEFSTGYEEHAVDATINGNAHPATEEQCRLLFQKIKEAGYKWNVETKTLEKFIEQKFKIGDKVRHKDNHNVTFTITGIEDDCYIGRGKKMVFQFSDQDNYELVPVEPKFKVGDKITNGKISIIIDYIDNEYYYEVGRNIANRLFIKNQDEWNLVSNKFNITSLKPFDKVLVRDKNTEEWRAHFFSHYHNNSDKPYICIGTVGLNEYKKCIPFKGNEYLRGKTDNCNDFYKNW